MFSNVSCSLLTRQVLIISHQKVCTQKLSVRQNVSCLSVARVKKLDVENQELTCPSQRAVGVRK